MWYTINANQYYSSPYILRKELLRDFLGSELLICSNDVNAVRMCAKPIDERKNVEPTDGLEPSRLVQFQFTKLVQSTAMRSWHLQRATKNN